MERVAVYVQPVLVALLHPHIQVVLELGMRNGMIIPGNEKRATTQLSPGRFFPLLPVLILIFLVTGCDYIMNVFIKQALFLVRTEPVGPNCEFGGLRIEEGTDKDQNGILNSSELSGSEYVCNEKDRDAFYAIDEISDKDGCDYGGVYMRAGLFIDMDVQGGPEDPASGVSSKICSAEKEQVVVYALTSTRELMRSGDTAVITVKAYDSMGSALSYTWSTTGGMINAISPDTVTWTAPNSAGSFAVSVAVENSSGKRVTAQLDTPDATDTSSHQHQASPTSLSPSWQ